MRLVVPVVIATFAAALLGPADTHAIYEHVRSWGGEGSAVGQLKSPMDVEVDSAGNLYVADKGNSRIQKFDREGNVLSVWSNLTPDLPWPNNAWPTKILALNDGTFLIYDTHNGTLSKFNSAGALLSTWVFPKEPDDRGLPQQVGPKYIAKGPKGSLFVSETFYKGSPNTEMRVRRYGENGVPQSLVYRKIVEPAPGGVTQIGADDDGNVYGFGWLLIKDWFIVKYSPTGELLSRWGVKHTKTKESRLIRPYDIEAGEKGYVFVSDGGRKVIKKFTSSGRYVGKWGKKGKGAGEFWAPKGMAVDSEGSIYVADSGNHQIHKFRPDRTRPKVRKLRLTKRKIRVGGRKRASKIKLTLSEDADVRLTVKKREGISFKRIGTISFEGEAGKVVRKFRGYVNKRQLPRGSYRLIARATDGAGNRSKTKRASFSIVGQR